MNAAASHLHIASAAVPVCPGWSVVLQLSLLIYAPTPHPPADWRPPTRRRPRKGARATARRAAGRAAPPLTDTATPKQTSLVDWLSTAPAAPRAPAGELLSAAAQLERRIAAQRDAHRVELDAATCPRRQAALQAQVDDCCWRLVLPWLPMLRRQAAKWAEKSRRRAAGLCASPYTADELYSEALEEAFKAARRFDPTRSSCRFWTTMYRPVHARLRDLCRWRHSRQRSLGPLQRLDAPYTTEDTTALLLHELAAPDSLPAPGDALDAVHPPRVLAALLDRARLTAQEREVLTLHHGLHREARHGGGEPQTFRAMAITLGISKSLAQKRHARAMRKLRAL